MQAFLSFPEFAVAIGGRPARALSGRFLP